MIKSVNDIVEKIALYGCMFALASLFLLIAGNSTLRFAAGINLLWVYDYCRVLSMVFVFFGASVMVRRKLHVKFAFAEQRMPPMVNRIVRITFSLIMLATFCIIAYYGFRLSYTTRIQTLPASGLPATFLYVPIGIMGVFGSLFMIEHIWDDVKPTSWKSGVSSV